MGNKLTVTGLTMIVAFPLVGLGALIVPGAIIMIIGCILYVLDK